MWPGCSRDVHVVCSHEELPCCILCRIVSEDTPLRTRRSLLASSGLNQTSITLEFGNLPTPNITTPEPPTVSQEIAMAGETNDSVDLEVNP